MEITKKRKLPIVLAAFSILLDGLMTALGQPKGFWTGASVNPYEANPVANYFMEVHFSVVVVVFILYFFLLMFLLTKMSGQFQVTAAIVLIFGHGLGVITWMVGVGGILKLYSLLGRFAWPFYRVYLFSYFVTNFVLPLVFFITMILWLRSMRTVHRAATL